MKTLIIASASILLTTVIGATELSWVDEQIQAIKPPRKGAKISNIAGPFVFLEKNKTIKSSGTATTRKSVRKSSGVTKTVCDTTDKVSIKGLTLSTVINSSAMINGAWYKKNDKVKSYTIINVSKTSVTLKKGDKTLTLSTNSKKQNLKFKNK